MTHSTHNRKAVINQRVLENFDRYTVESTPTQEFLESTKPSRITRNTNKDKDKDKPRRERFND